MKRLASSFLLLAVLLSLAGCSQGVQRDFGFVPQCFRERTWDEAKGVVVIEPVCTEPAFYQRLKLRNQRP